RHGSGRFDPVHRDVPGDVPEGADPRDRTGRPRLAGTRAEREPASGRLRAVLPRGDAAAGPVGGGFGLTARRMYVRPRDHSGHGGGTRTPMCRSPLGEWHDTAPAERYSVKADVVRPGDTGHIGVLHNDRSPRHVPAVIVTAVTVFPGSLAHGAVRVMPSGTYRIGTVWVCRAA